MFIPKKHYQIYLSKQIMRHFSNLTGKIKFGKQMQIIRVTFHNHAKYCNQEIYLGLLGRGISNQDDLPTTHQFELQQEFIDDVFESQ